MSEKEKLEKEIHHLMNKQYERGLSPVERLKLEELQARWDALENARFPRLHPFFN